MSDLLRKHRHGTIKQIDRTKREITALLTHQVVDADGEVVLAGGVDWSRWRHNAPMLYQHDRERKVGNWDPASLRLTTIDGAPGWVAKGRLFSTGALADQVYQELQEGSTGVSIGFRAKQADLEPVRPGQTGRTFRSVEIIEASLVTLQSCPTCVVLEKSARGGRGSEIVLEVEDDAPIRVLKDDGDEVRYRIAVEEEPRYTFEEADLRAAVQTVIGARVREEVARQSRGLLGVVSAPVLRVEDESGAVHEITGDMLREAIGAALSRTVGQRVHAAICELTGRLD